MISRTHRLFDSGLRFLPTTALVAVLAACGEAEAPPSVVVEGGLQIKVAPLDLEQIGFSCFDIKVFAVTNPGIPTVELVWERGDYNVNRADAFGVLGDTDTICSNVFGNGPLGDIFYVGTCDATYPQHIVQLVVDGLYKPTGVRLPEGDDWSNPCPPASPCEFYATCVENADTPVLIDLTIARSANQGFFDIGVRFDEIFCSAKVDCSYATTDDQGNPVNDPIMLVHNADGEPDNTAVIGFACTAGAGDTDLTELYLNPPRIDCGNLQYQSVLDAGVMCHPGADGPELLTYYWFQQGIGAGKQVDITLQLAEMAQWLDSPGGWSQSASLPTVDVGTATTYDVVVPRETLDANRIVVYAIRFGDSLMPPAFGGQQGIETISLGVISRTPGSTAWEQLDILPGLGAPGTYATQYMRDPTTNRVVVVGITPDGAGYLTYTFHLFTLGAGPGPTFTAVESHPVPAGINAYPQAFIGDVMTVYMYPDWNHPDPLIIPEGYYHHLWGWSLSGLFPAAVPPAVPDPDVYQDVANLLNGPITMTDSAGQIWQFSGLTPWDQVSVLGPNRLMINATWTNQTTFGQMGFPVELALADDGFGNRGFIATPITTTPAFNTFQSGSYYGWIQGEGRWLVHYGTPVGDNNWIQYITLFTDSRAPYTSDWRTWRVPTYNGNQAQVQTVVEGIAGRVAIVFGYAGGWQQAPTTQFCDPQSNPYWYCNNPPPNNGWSAQCIQVGADPNVGECQYQVYINELIWGTLDADPTATEIAWRGELPLPFDSTWYWVEGVRERANGRSFIGTYSGQTTWGYVVYAFDESAFPPVLANTNIIERGTYQSVGMNQTYLGNLWQYRFDVRARVGPDSCDGIYTGSADADPDPLLPNYYAQIPLAWNLDGPSLVGTEPPGSLLFQPTALAPSTGFMDAAEGAVIAASQPIQSYYVLPVDTGDGYAWDIVNDPPDPGVVFQYGLYYGEEAITCDGEPCNKKYFNIAIGLETLYPNCVLAFEATAAQPGVINAANGWETPPNSVYPVVVARVNLTPDIFQGGDGSGVCEQNPLNGEDSGVQVMYTHGTDIDGFPFCYRLLTDGTTVESLCPPDVDYSWLDQHPIFTSQNIIQMTSLPGGPIAAPLSLPEDKGVGIAEFTAAWPACPEGLLYDPNRFACLGVCGDGVRSPEEGCDDGNTDPGDRCSSTCRIEVVCGDGTTVIDADRLCDGRKDCPGAGAGWDERPDLCVYCEGNADPLPLSARCDGTRDCRDGRDEVFCAAPETP